VVFQNDRESSLRPAIFSGTRQSFAASGAKFRVLTDEHVVELVCKDGSTVREAGVKIAAKGASLLSQLANAGQSYSYWEMITRNFNAPDD
jgi:hypothetical protein